MGWGHKVSIRADESWEARNKLIGAGASSDCSSYLAATNSSFSQTDEAFFRTLVCWYNVWNHETKWKTERV